MYCEKEKVLLQWRELCESDVLKESVCALLWWQTEQRAMKTMPEVGFSDVLMAVLK